MQQTFTHVRMLCLMLCVYTSTQAQVVGGRLGEVFKSTTLNTSANAPWDITYGPDGFLWVTEANGYRVRRVNPITGAFTAVLDLQYNTTNNQTTSGISNADFNTYKRTFDGTETDFQWPQGGMMGLALHPDFNGSKPYVYLAYVRSYTGRNTTTTVNATYPDGQGQYFKTFLTRWTWNATLGKLTSPVMLCDTIPGSNDHNSGRIIIAPVNGVDYLFYALGDMGAGQFSNQNRIIRAQDPASYQGKILRFNLEEDTDADQGAVDYNKWIPNNNPYGTNSAVWAIGIRNNQGFDYKVINGVGRLYGASHGPYSDDEINILEEMKNYGHPLVVGYAADGNYNGAKAGVSGGSLPLIVSESANATTIGSSYRDPIYSNYPSPRGTGASPWTPYHSIQTIYQNPIVDVDPVTSGTQRPQSANGFWWSEGYSGMEIYPHSTIPGWKNSILLASLKWGRVVRMKLNSAGTAITPVDGSLDTVSYFGSQNRFRDVSYSPDGKSLFVVMDQSGTTSGPSALNPIVPACAGCIQKYEFLGYNNNAGVSTIPTHIPIATGTDNTCVTVNSVVINADNTNLWVPITDADGNIVAEIRANGNALGTVSTTLYKSNTQREDASKRLFLNRNMAISVTGTGPFNTNGGVGLRIYLTAAEYNALRTGINSLGASSGIDSKDDLGLFKTAGSGCFTNVSGIATPVTVTSVDAFGSNGYVINAALNSFSSFYVANNSLSVLPIELKDLKANWMGSAATITWSTATESGADGFDVERSTDGRYFTSIGFVKAKGNSISINNYRFNDMNASSVSGNTIYYRLKLKDLDGRSVYSAVVNITRTAAAFIVKVFPNPVKSQATLSIFADKDDVLQWQLTNAAGKVVRTQTASIAKGQNNILVDMNALPAGIYQLQASGKHFSQVLKIQKQ